MVDPKTGERLGAQRRTQQREGGRLLMLRAVSTYVYVKERLHPGILDELVRAGAQAIEIFAARQHFDYANRKQHVREIAEWFKSTGIPLNSVHAPLVLRLRMGADRFAAGQHRIHRPRRAHRCDGRDQTGP